MNKTKKINTILIIIFSLLLITIISFSFAHFNTRITNNETNTTIASGSGIMEITYSGGENINAPNIFPDSNPFIIKEFTITGKNSNEEEMHYHLFLVLDENTFRSSALTFTLESNNLDNNGHTVPDIITQTGIKTGEREIFLGNGKFNPTNNKNKTHSYTLKLYFPKIDNFDHGVDQGKTFGAHIEIREGEIYPGYNAEKGVNHPVLFTGMTPIKWDDNNIEINTTEDDPGWYDYNEKRWANAKSLDGSYWVWIPRYAYKIETCYHTSGEDCLALTGKEAGDIDIKFLKGTTNLTDDNTVIESTGYEAHVKDTSMHHFLHPAFQFNGEELGFWVAKFFPSAVEGMASSPTLCAAGDNVFTKTPIIKPNLYIWGCIDIKNSFNVGLAMKNNSVIYGWLSMQLDSHIMTNQEWGAVAYLSKSQYGADGKIWNNAYSGFVTGCSGVHEESKDESICVKYNTENGVKASTTYNIYGIYDMSAGAWNLVMGNYNYLPGNSGFNQKTLQNIEMKYLTNYYTRPDLMYGGEGMGYNQNIYGDAIYEVSFNAHKYRNPSDPGNTTDSWNKTYSILPYDLRPWFTRGGFWNDGASAGVFAFSRADGNPFWGSSFRPVLAPL